MKATVLVDNIANGELKGEWGLSIYMEYGDKKILLDTGASDLYLDNANKLNLSIEDVDYAVISHAHGDHSNGINSFFHKNDQAKMYLQEAAAENCYYKKWIFRKYIGLPKKILTVYNQRIEYAKGDYELCQGVYLIPHKTSGLDSIGKREMMYQKKADGWFPDDFSHEQSLVFETEKGLVIFNSCSHAGAANIIDEVARTFPNKKVYGLIGGFHLYNKSEKEIRELACKIKETGIQYVCTGHCTKERAYKIMKEELGDMLHQLQVGLVMEF